MHKSTGTTSTETSNRRLDSWKEIAAFFERDESTMKRWEKQRGLPIHRVPGSGRARIYAYESELREWFAGAGDPDRPEETTTEANPIAPVPQRQSHRLRVWMGLAAMVLLGAVAGFVGVRSHFARPYGVNEPIQKIAHTNPEAEDLYLKGVYNWQQRTPEGLNQAVDYFTQAIVRDPNYAEAYVGLADSYNLLREYSLMPEAQAYPRAKAAAERAIQLNEKLPGAHAALGFVDFYWSWDVAGARREFSRALELDPNAMQAHYWYANILLCLGENQEAIEQIEAARKLDPGSRAILADKGLILYDSGQETAALALLKEVETAEPEFLSPHAYLAAIYRATGDSRGYLREAAKVAQLRHDERLLSVVQAGERGFQANGKAGMHDAMLRRQEELHSAGDEEVYELAQTNALAGHKQRALDYLQQAYQRREPRMVGLRTDPALRDLRNEPEFQDLVTKVGLA